MSHASAIPTTRDSRVIRRLFCDDRAAQLVEFAVALPLLVVMVVGIFDFSGAFSIKMKLTNAARDAARAAAADPATDLGSGGTPASVIDAFQVADTYLTTNNLNDCGITVANLEAGSGTTALTWTASAGGGTCPPNPGMTQISINRGFVSTASIGKTPTRVIQTQVTIQYSYSWHFDRVISLLVSGTTYAAVTTLTATATAMNEN